MMNVVDWILANWQPVLLGLLAVDQILIGIFPQVALLGNLKDFLSKLLPAPKQ